MMKVKDVMTSECEYIAPTASLQKAAQRMRDLECGFLPIGANPKGKLEGVITDRDIVIRAVAEGMNPTTTLLSEIETHHVFYCYQSDSVEVAAESMRDQQVYRLIVLNNDIDKKLCGVITLGDILRHSEEELATKTAKSIMNKAA